MTTTLKEFVGKSWADHGDDAEGVFARLPEGLALVEGLDDLPPLAGLIVHVAGEHCGQWGAGVSLLNQLVAHEAFDGESPAGKSVWRSLAILHHCADDPKERAECLERGRSGEGTEASDEVRVLAIASSALVGQKRIGAAAASFTRALDLAAYGPGKDDLAARALAITGNNLACELEGKADRTDEESRLMLQAAQTGRRFWEISGTWTNVERAEYRLACTHLKLGDAAGAIEHAGACLAICTENEADPGEFFFGHEALSRAWHAKGDAAKAAEHRARAAERLAQIEDEGLRAYCAGELAKLDAALA